MMRPETAISAALYALYQQKGDPQIGYRDEVIQLLRGLQDTDVKTPGLNFRASPGGLQSDDVSQFIGRLAMGGYLVQESPIRLTEYGIELLRSHLRERLERPEVTEVLAALGIDDLTPIAHEDEAIV